MRNSGSMLAEKIGRLYPEAELSLNKSGEELLLSGGEQDILLLDIQMPGKDGMETAKVLRRKNKKPSLVVTTGGRHITVNPEDIVYAEVFDRKVILHTMDADIEYYGKIFVANGQKIALPMPEDKALFRKIGETGLQNTDMGLRPQNVKYSFTPEKGYFRTTVYSYESIGNKSVIQADCGDYQLRMIAPNGLKIRIDEDIYVRLEVEHAMFFNPQTKEYVCRYNEESIRAFAAEQEVR